jgi:stage II sporulation protein D
MRTGSVTKLAAIRLTRKVTDTPPVSFGTQIWGTGRARLLAGLAALSLVSCGGPRATPAAFPGGSPTPAGAGTLAPRTLKIRVAGRVDTVALEDYVAATALSEITPVGESADTVARIYDVQTVVARTYALAHLGRHRAEGFDVCDQTHCQLFEPARLATSRFADAARRATARTAGQVLTYGGRPIDALFHADCGGNTASPEQVWGTAGLPYLRPTLDDVPAVTHRTWTLTLTRADLVAALSVAPRTTIGDQLRSVLLDGPDSSGRVSRVTINGNQRQVILRSDDFRTVVNARLGTRAIMSTRFRMWRADNGIDYEVQGTGFGHGVGLCQVGALARARRGDSVGAILAAYFPGARLMTAGGKLP